MQNAVSTCSSHCELEILSWCVPFWPDASVTGSSELLFSFCFSLLLPKIREAGTSSKFARIVSVSSAAHFVGSWMDFNDLQSK